MKTISLILLFLIAGCQDGPLYHYGDQVRFKLPPFYSVNCKDVGRVVAIKEDTDNFTPRYTYTIADVTCERQPGLWLWFDFQIKENDIEAKVSK